MSRCCSQANWFFGAILFVGTGVLGMIVAGNVKAKTETTGEEITLAHVDGNQEETKTAEGENTVNSEDGKKIATLGAGCFWCVEAVFEELEGVSAVSSGYMGGHVDNPTYRQVCEGTTGHAEVCRVLYDPEKISFERILEVFWKTHDPTTLNRQGYDTGTQYRSAVFYHDEEQKQAAERLKKRLDDSGAFNDPIVTEITAASKYYPAENYHQNYFSNNPNQRYCQAVIVPKMEKFRKVFKDDLKKKK